MWRSWESYSPAMARRLMTSRLSPSVIWTRSMYGSWFPSVSTQMLYGFRSKVQVGVVIGEVIFQADVTGSSGFREASFLNLKRFTQLSMPAALTASSTCSFGVYFG